MIKHQDLFGHLLGGEALRDKIGYKTSAPMSRKLSANIAQNHSKYWTNCLIELASLDKRRLLEPLFAVQNTSSLIDLHGLCPLRTIQAIGMKVTLRVKLTFGIHMFLLPMHLASLQPPHMDLSPPRFNSRIPGGLKAVQPRIKKLQID